MVSQSPVKIPVNDLISKDFESFTKSLVEADGYLDVYIHRPSGLVDVSGGDFGNQTIEALSTDDNIYGFIVSSLKKIDQDIDLDFRIVEDRKSADIRFYMDSTINLDEGEGTTLGVAITNTASSEKFWEIMINKPAFKGQEDYLRYAIIHEFGHAFGLEHPFDDSDGDFYVSSDSDKSAFPEETVMAYRYPSGETWPSYFSSNDIFSLKQIWGSESTKKVSKIIGSKKSDRLIGGSGSDLIFGNSGNDILIGKSGADELWGGKGSNRFWTGKDKSIDKIYITRDGSSSLTKVRRTVDRIAYLGKEDKVAILGSKTSQIRVRKTKLNSRSQGRLNGVGIFVGRNLEAIYTGGGLTVSDIKDQTIGLPANYTGDLG